VLLSSFLKWSGEMKYQSFFIADDDDDDDDDDDERV